MLLVIVNYSFGQNHPVSSDSTTNTMNLGLSPDENLLLLPDWELLSGELIDETSEGTRSCFRNPLSLKRTAKMKLTRVKLAQDLDNQAIMVSHLRNQMISEDLAVSTKVIFESDNLRVQKPGF